MIDSTRYPVPAGRCSADDTVDRSRFICDLTRAATTDDAQAFVREIEATYPDATHHCWAFVVGPPGSTSHVGMSDDGEPHGTAGRPMLTVLLHSGIGEIVAVVTRYYGGTKLGTGGLARAYAAAVQAALTGLPTTERVEYASLVIVVSYAHLSPVRHLLAGFEAVVANEDFGEHVTVTLRVPRMHLYALRMAVGNITSGQAIFPDDTQPSA